MMEDFNSETDSDYTSYWRDWVRLFPSGVFQSACAPLHVPRDNVIVEPGDAMPDIAYLMRFSSSTSLANSFGFTIFSSSLRAEMSTSVKSMRIT